MRSKKDFVDSEPMTYAGKAKDKCCKPAAKKAAPKPAAMNAKKPPARLFSRKG